MTESNGRPPYHEERAQSFVGKTVLVGLSYEDSDGNPLGQRQIHGRIVAANSHEGFCVRLAGLRAGDHYWLPPDLRPWQQAPAGEYRLRSTGEVLTDPDLLCNWLVTRADGKLPQDPSAPRDPDRSVGPSA